MPKNPPTEEQGRSILRMASKIVCTYYMSKEYARSIGFQELIGWATEAGVTAHYNFEEGGEAKWSTYIYSRMRWFVWNRIRSRIRLEEKTPYYLNSLEGDKSHGVTHAEIPDFPQIDIREMVNNLPSKEAKVLRRVFFQGRTCADIARELGTTRQYVNEVKLRGLNRLRKRMQRRGYTANDTKTVYNPISGHFTLREWADYDGSGREKHFSI